MPARTSPAWAIWTIELLQLVKAQQIDGKAVVYPHRRTQNIHSVDSWSGADERSYLQASEI